MASNDRQTWRNYIPSKGEVNTKDSLTVPDQTLTLEELIQRHTRGQGVTTFMPNYSTEEEYELGIDLSAIRKMDTFQKLEHSRKIKRQLETYRETGQTPEPVITEPETTPEPKTE